jgi:class 3 adenylate cyclase/alpha-beta hydrolase superfamily lysophospholipase
MMQSVFPKIHIATPCSGSELTGPETKYAKSGEVHIAYQVFGRGDIDLVVVPGWASHVEYAWEDPVLAHFLNRLGTFSRVTWFDKRGTGLSDRDVGMPTLELRMDDVRAVMDTVGIERAAIFGISEGGSMSALFAAAHPERTSALILFGSFARRIKSPDYPWAPTLEERKKWMESLEKGWGGDVELNTLAPSRANDERFVKWFTAYGRLSVSPSAAVALAKMNTYIDIRAVLHSIHVPTLILHRKGDRDVNVGNGIYLSKNIAGSKLVVLGGEDHFVAAGDSNSIANELEEFLTGTHPAESPDRVLSTVLFTDIVGSTKKAAELGDSRWLSLLQQHNMIVREELFKFRGREVKTTGDGFVAIFDGPGRAVRCAQSIMDSAKSIGISIRAGVHTGEVELVEDDIAGVAVHIASRIAGMAGGGEVFVSNTVKDLVSGSGIRFVDRGHHVLKGIEGRWRIYSASV